LASVGFLNLLSGGSYKKPVMAVLDAIKDSREGSPLFRAFLFTSLVEFMEFQPDAWGLSFCPAARAHVTQIRSIVGGPIASGDWFVPTKAERWGGKLEQFFAAAKPLSYARQAAGNLSLAQAAAGDRLRYVGFAGLDGKPVATGNPAPAEMWGYDPTNRRPILVSNLVMPLSPLFALPHPRADYLAKAGVSAGDASFTDALPPLFRLATTP
jgi:hypothetical protein